MLMKLFGCVVDIAFIYFHSNLAILFIFVVVISRMITVPCAYTADTHTRAHACDCSKNMPKRCEDMKTISCNWEYCFFYEFLLQITYLKCMTVVLRLFRSIFGLSLFHFPHASEKHFLFPAHTIYSYFHSFIHSSGDLRTIFVSVCIALCHVPKWAYFHI